MEAHSKCLLSLYNIRFYILPLLLPSSLRQAGYVRYIDSSSRSLMRDLGIQVPTSNMKGQTKSLFLKLESVCVHVCEGGGVTLDGLHMSPL